MVLLDDRSDPAPAPGKPPISQDRRNELNHALLLMLAKMRCRGHALSCYLDELPLELTPRHARRSETPPAPHSTLVVSSSFRYQPRGEAPPELRSHAPLMDGLLREGPVVWVKDTGTGVWTPFWARDEWIEAVEALRAGEPAPRALAPHVRQTLATARVLVPPGAEEERRNAWEQTCRAARTQFQTYGYAIVRGLIHPVLIGALRRYYRALVAGGQLPRGDDQVAERYRLHSEPVAMFFHSQLAGLVGRIAAEPVKPSYLYFASYPPGSALPRHVDRLQCEFSISLLVDYHPEPDGPCGWPLCLEDPGLPGGVVAADLGLGDALLYRGRQLVHYRDRLPDGHQSSSIFFHYLRQDFVGDTF